MSFGRLNRGKTCLVGVLLGWLLVAALPVLGQQTQGKKTGRGKKEPAAQVVLPKDSANAPATVRDSIRRALHRQDSLKVDTIRRARLDSLRKQSAVQDSVPYSGRDSITLDMDDQLMNLYTESHIKYQNIQITANRIKVNMKTNLMEAEGSPDSSGEKTVGKPIFVEKDQTYNTDQVAYNLKSKKAKVIYTRSKQGQNVLIARVSQRNPDGSFYTRDGKFTTCDLDHPHFYIRSNKLKVIPGDKIVSGPLYMVIADVPFPVVIPFGFFPQHEGRHSGVLFPTFGQDYNRGFNARNGGYYFAPTENIDLTFRGDIYTGGSNRIEILSNYKSIYHYNGSFDVSRAINQYNTEGDPDYSKNQSIQILWNHSQIVSPTTSFSAHVTASSSNYLAQNSYNVNDVFQRALTSSIAYQTHIPNSGWNITANADLRQDLSQKLYTFNLPIISVQHDRFYPFRKPVQVGQAKWYENIGVTYGASIQNQLSIHEQNLFTKYALDSMRNGINHRASISTNFKLFKFLVFTPSINYNEYWYLKTIDPYYTSRRVDSVYVTNTQEGIPVARDSSYFFQSTAAYHTVHGFQSARDFNFSIGTSTKLYGLLQLKGPRRTTFRHTVTPAISLTYRPDFSDPSWGFYKKVQADSTGRVFTRVSRFSQGILGGPAAGRSASIGFTLYNLFEMKQLPRQDTNSNKVDEKAPAFKYTTLLDNFGFSANYNLAADSFKLSNIPISARTSLFNNKVNIQGSANLDPYVKAAVFQKTPLGKDSIIAFRDINQYQIGHNHSLGTITNAALSVAFQLRSHKKTKNPDTQDGKNKELGPLKPQQQSDLSEIDKYRQQYIDFNLPWSLSFSYTMSYNHPFFANQQAVTQSLSVSGDIQLTPRWRFSTASGYDFVAKKLILSTINISRDLHCWDFSFNAVPFGIRKSYNLVIKVKAQMLQDLRITKRRDWQDQFATGVGPIQY